MKLYAQLRQTMLENYEQTDFSPTAVSEPTKSMEEMSKEEFKEHKKNADGQQKAINLGYDTIKAKVKKLRSNFQKAVAEGTRSGRALRCILISSAAFKDVRAQNVPTFRFFLNLPRGKVMIYFCQKGKKKEGSPCSFSRS